MEAMGINPDRKAFVVVESELDGILISRKAGSLLNAFLQFIEQDHSDSIIIAATNNPKLLDNALFRRFEDVLNYNLPNEKERHILIENIMGTFLGIRFAWKNVLKLSKGLSHAEIDYACKDTVQKICICMSFHGQKKLF